MRQTSFLWRGGLRFTEVLGHLEAPAELGPSFGVEAAEAPVGEHVLGEVRVQEAEAADRGDAGQGQALDANRASGATVEDEPLVEGSERGIVRGDLTVSGWKVEASG